MNAKHIVLSERSHTENPTCCMTPLSGKVQSRHIYRNRKEAIGWWDLVVDCGNNRVSPNGIAIPLGRDGSTLKLDCAASCTALQ